MWRSLKILSLLPELYCCVRTGRFLADWSSKMQHSKEEDYFPVKLSFSPLLMPRLTWEEKTEFCDTCLLKLQPDIILLVTSEFNTIQDIIDVIRGYYKIPLMIMLKVDGFHLDGQLPVKVLKQFSGPIAVVPLQFVKMTPRCRGHDLCKEDCSSSLQEFARTILSPRATTFELDTDNPGFITEEETRESLMISTDDVGAIEVRTESVAADNEGQDNVNEGAVSTIPSGGQQTALVTASNGTTGSSIKRRHTYGGMPESMRQTLEVPRGNLFMINAQEVAIPVRFGVLPVISLNAVPFAGAEIGGEGHFEGGGGRRNRKERHTDPGFTATSRKRNYETAFSKVVEFIDSAKPAFKSVCDAIAKKFKGDCEGAEDSSQRVLLSSPMSMVKYYDPEDYASQLQWKPLNDHGLKDVGINSLLKFKISNMGEAEEMSEDLVLIVREVQENSVTGSVMGLTGQEQILTVNKAEMKNVRIWQQNNGNNDGSQL